MFHVKEKHRGATALHQEIIHPEAIVLHNVLIHRHREAIIHHRTAAAEAADQAEAVPEGAEGRS